MLALGIWSHISFKLKLRAWRHELAEAQVIVAQDTFPAFHDIGHCCRFDGDWYSSLC
ncbi:MAG TPA: hypothetical protein VE133_10455 [Candidatus Sulfotelmatobacter sp.]|nr:hypothetical protein [Candidatus Sulfotelmatobacter sp.]